MRAKVGDELTVKGILQGDESRHGENDSPSYVVRWRDGHESVFFPTSGTVVEHYAARKRSRRERRAQ